MEDLRRAYEASGPCMGYCGAQEDKLCKRDACWLMRACLWAVSTGQSAVLASLAQPHFISCLSMLGEQQNILLLEAEHWPELLCTVPSYQQGPGHSCWCRAWLGSSTSLQNVANNHVESTSTIRRQSS